jgi:hypothetical protein
MRWGILTGIALVALLIITAAIGRVIQVVSFFGPASGSGSESLGSAAPYADDPVARPAAPGTSETAHPVAEKISADKAVPGTQALPTELDETLRRSATGATDAPSKRPPPEARHGVPGGALDQDLRPVIAQMKLDPSDPGAQVEELAQKVAPTLAREAIEHSDDNAARNADVEHELLETLKEQKQILAGQRDTPDSVLKAAP